MCQGALTRNKANTWLAVAHIRLVIFVLLRISASAAAPLDPI